MRTFTISSETGMAALRGSLIDRRISVSRADAAIARLRALNPHVDLDRAAAGTVIFVPDGPEFTARSGDSPAATATEELRSAAAAALDAAAEQLKAGLAERAAERETARAALDSDVFRRTIAGDQDMQQRAREARTALDEDEDADRNAAETLDTAGKAALDALSALGKLAG